MRLCGVERCPAQQSEEEEEVTVLNLVAPPALTVAQLSSTSSENPSQKVAHPSGANLQLVGETGAERRGSVGV